MIPPAGLFKCCFRTKTPIALKVMGYCWIAMICGTGKPGVGVAELRIAETIWSAVQLGWAARRRAATPAARGAEALVPMAWTYWVWPRLKQP